MLTRRDEYPLAGGHVAGTMSSSGLTSQAHGVPFGLAWHLRVQAQFGYELQSARPRQRPAFAPAIAVLPWVCQEMKALLGTVVDAAIGWLVQSILGSFFTGHMEAFACEAGLAEDVEKLKFQMRYVEMVLAAAKGRRIDNKPLAQSLDDLKELLYDSEDVMDELDYYRLQQQIAEGRGCSAPSGADTEGSYVSSSASSYALELVHNATSQVTSWASCSRKRKRQEDLEERPAYSTILTFEIKNNISERINGIVIHLCTIGNSVQRVLQLALSCPVATSSESHYITRNARLTTSVPIESKVYGRDAERDNIVERLVNGKSSDLNVLPVIGIGGVGKTTLARFVYRDQRIRDDFDLQMWVCVSTNFDEVRLTLEILEHVCENRQEYENVSNFNVLQEILVKYIGNKKFLLVLDDMWEDKDMSGWIKLLAPLKNQVTGCMVLVTTRTKSVAKMIGTMNEVRVSGLDENEFWLLFRACAFGNENYEGHPSLQSIGKQICKSLKGCPLAARSVGALLNTSVSDKHWRKVQDKWKYLQEDADDILPILKLSYDYLPVHLQHCFSYCSLFPEDHRFNGEKLVQAWISQNFVQCKDPTIRLEETGQTYLDSLVDLGFFQKVGSQYVMHDLMHELAGKVSSNQCATIHGLKPETILPSVRHLSIITTAFDKVEHGSFPIEKFDRILQKVSLPQKLRTLMLFGRSSLNLLRPLQRLCKEAKCLRFLRIYLTAADISSAYSSLNSCHLRYLEIVYVVTNRTVYDGYSKIPFPQALTRFYHLQVLDVGISWNAAVPTDMNNLVNLRHLIAHEEVHHAINCVGNMTFLQELKFKVQNVGIFEIGQLQSMNELVSLGISQLQNVKTKEEARGARLIDKEYLQTLSLTWEDSRMSLQLDTATDVLEGLEPHQNVKTLEITGYGGGSSPTWLSSALSLTSLQILHLEKCREWRILPSLEMLPFLGKLTLIGMFNVMEIPIPSLEELILINMPKLKKCIGSYGMELTSHLKVLVIKNCPQLNEFTPFQSYSSFNTEQKSWFPTLRKLSIAHCPHIIKWKILTLREMKVLKELELMDLHVVRELSVPCLEKLVLINMPSLETCISLKASPPLQFLPSQGDQKESTSSLCRLTIHDCPCLIVSHPLPFSGQISESSIKRVRRLPNLSINHRHFNIESHELTVLDSSILAFHNLRGITRFSITNCPNLVSLSSEAFSQLTALEDLCIRDCPNLTKSNIMSEDVQENFTSASNLVLPSLKSLHISRCGITGRWLTQMLSHSQSLKTLQVNDCPQIKFLSIIQPAETGTSSSVAAVMTSAHDEHQLKIPCNTLCSLKELSITFCPDLEFCGGKVEFGVFTSLVKLELTDCPKLVLLLVGETKDDGTVEVGLLPPSLEDICISHFPENLQSFIPEGLLHLKKLSIRSSRYLKSVELHACMALEELQILGCVQLAVLEGLQFLTSLRRLDLMMNPELSRTWEVETQEQEGGNRIQLLPPSLERLQIWKLTDGVQSRLLTYLPAITKLAIRGPELTSLQLGCCRTLKELEIENCDSLVSIEGLQFCRNLTFLKVLCNFPGLASCLGFTSHQQGASEIWSGLDTIEISDLSVLCTPLCQQLTSLRRLILFGKQKESMVNLTVEQERALQLLTSLQELQCFMCPNLSSLPANLHRLTSLERLFISHCASITRLPDMGLPPSLRYLWLSDCSEELGMQCRMTATEKLRIRIDNESLN